MRKGRKMMERIGERLDIPSEVLPGGFSLTLAGGRELTLWGCRRILSYEENEILLAVGKRRLRVLGERLLCSAFGEKSITIAGEIASLHLEGERE